MTRLILIIGAIICIASLVNAEENLPKPKHVSSSGNEKKLSSNILAARRYAAFWNTGEERFAEEALAADFTDRTLPPGRPQGKQGPLKASKMFRAAVPDLTVEIEDLVAAHDRVAVHLRFRGHFTGLFGSTKGTGQEVDFQAFDLYRIQDGKIVDNWHLEDTLTFLQQIGIVGK